MHDALSTKRDVSSKHSPPTLPPTLPPILGEALRWGGEYLHAQGIEPSKDAEWLLQHCTAYDAHHCYTQPETLLSSDEWHQYLGLSQRRAQGEPLAYICGYTEFFGRRIDVDERVLIPRPETEQLVEHVLSYLSMNASMDASMDAPLAVADLGSGSGAIAITLAAERPEIKVTAVERSEDALAVATENIAKAGMAERITLKRGDWCDAFESDERFSLIVANPPYVNEGDPSLDQAPLRCEPRSALAAAQCGRADLLRIIEQAGAHLHAGGALYLEHAAEQAEWVAKTMREHGWSEVRTLCDLETRPLFSCAIAKE